MAARAAQRDLVRRGYDAISVAYRSDDGQPASSSAEDVSRYPGWAAELADLLPAGATVADLGCGIGLPATRALADHGLAGHRRGLLRSPARPGTAPGPRSPPGTSRHDRAAPAARQPGCGGVLLRPHPRAASRPAGAVPRIRSWLRPGGYLLAITGAERWTGTEDYLGASMFWDHADIVTYLSWLTAARLTPQWHRYIPEGDSGHSLILARAW